MESRSHSKPLLEFELLGANAPFNLSEGMYSDTLAVEDGEPMLGEIGAETAASTEPALQVHMPTRSVNSSDFELADTSPGAVAHNTIEDHCVTELPVQSAHVEAPAGGDDVSVLSSVAPALRTAFIGDSSVFHGEDLLHASRELPSLGLSVNTIVCGGRDDLDSLPCSRLRATDDGFNSESDVMSADDVEPAPPCDPPVPCDDDDIDKQSTEPCELGIDLDRAADLGPAAHYPEPIHAGEAASASTSACCTPPPCAQRLAPPGTPTLDNECDQGDGDAVAGASTSSPALDDADAASIAAEKAPSFGANTPEPLTPAIGRQSSSEFCESPRGQGAGQIVIPEGSPRSSRDERGPRRFEMDGLVSRLDEVHVERLCSLSTELDELFSGFAEMACKIEAAAPGLAGESAHVTRSARGRRQRPAARTLTTVDNPFRALQERHQTWPTARRSPIRLRSSMRMCRSSAPFGLPMSTVRARTTRHRKQLALALASLTPHPAASRAARARVALSHRHCRAPRRGDVGRAPPCDARRRAFRTRSSIARAASLARSPPKRVVHGAPIASPARARSARRHRDLPDNRPYPCHRARPHAHARVSSRTAARRPSRHARWVALQ